MHDADSAALSEREPRFFRGFFFALLFALAAAALALAAAGCASEPPPLPPGAFDFVTNAAARVISELQSAAETPCLPQAETAPDLPAQMEAEAPAAPEPATAAAESPAAPESVAAAAPSAAPALVYRFGGFDGSKAAEVAAAQIKSLRLSSSGLSYAWASGGCEKLGASSASDYSQTLACAFYWSEKEQKWIGGKFDWISTSRTSRDWKNIRERYSGWDPDAFFGASRVAFCIVSKDGRRRTNLLEGAWK